MEWCGAPVSADGSVARHMIVNVSEVTVKVVCARTASTTTEQSIESPKMCKEDSQGAPTLTAKDSSAQLYLHVDNG